MKISVLGCGWLGFPFAKMLAEQGHIVKGATTSVDKLPIIAAEGILPYQILLASEGIVGNIEAFLEASEVLLINVPPKFRNSEAGDYLRKMKHLLLHVQNSSIEKVIIVSSTSVYEDAPHFPVYTETNNIISKSIPGKELYDAEQVFFKNEKLQCSVVRFGGLIDEERHPIRHLAGKTHVLNPKAPVNLIHKADGIKILRKIIENEAWGAVFNAVYPSHPSKSDYYTAKAKEMGLSSPIFNFEKPSEGKIIASEALAKRLKFQFEHPI